MKYSIIIPEKDAASLNIYDAILKEKLPKNAEIRKFDNESIYLDGIDKEVKGEILIFATRHRAASGKKSLTCHFPGNWDKAELGGKGRKLCFVPASLLKAMFINLKKNAINTDFEITLEATHHGPDLDKPAMFIELGSSEKEWNDTNGGKIIAKTIVETLSKNIPERKTYIALGSIHYPHDFNRIELETEIAISHHCPKYMLPNFDKEMLLQAISKSKEKCSGAIIDWKGMGDQKNRIIRLLNDSGINYIKSSDMLKE